MEIKFSQNLTWSEFEKRIREISNNKDGSINIKCVDISSISPSVFGWLFLFSLEQRQKITLHFEISGEGKPDKYYETLHLFQVLQLFNNSIEIKSSPPFSPTISSSEDFFPIVPITEDTYNQYLKRTFKEFIDGTLKVMQTDGFWKTFNRSKTKNKDFLNHIKKMFTLKDSSDKDKLSFIFLSYYLQLLSSLQYLKGFVGKLTMNCSNEFRIDGLSKKAGIGGFDRETTERYWEEIDGFLEEKVLNQPPFFVIMFSLMVTNFAPRPALNTTTANGELNKLYLLTNEYFYRILEVVDNIIEHTTSKKGVIVSRVWKKEKATIEYPNKATYFKHEDFKNVMNFLEISIMDIGEKGIITTSREKWEQYENEIFQEDAKTLENISKKVRLKAFFKPDIHFTHQSIRTAACMGLLMFSAFIDNNKGFFEVEDRDKSSNSGGSYYKQCYFEQDARIINTDFWGVKFQVFLPVDLLNIKPFALQEIYESPTTKSSLDFLAKNKIVIYQPKGKYNDNNIILYQAKIDMSKPTDIEKHVWEKRKAEEINKDFPTEDVQETILCLETQGIKGDNIANLFRIIGHLQEERPRRAIVIYNLTEEITLLLFDFLKPYIEGKFWSDKHFVLGFTEYAEPFIIGGGDKKDWLCLNSSIKKRYEASNRIISEIEAIVNIPNYQFDTEGFRSLIKENPLFFLDEEKGFGLVPLELFIKDSSGMTVFENRVAMILGNRIGERIIGEEPVGYKFEDAHIRLGSKIHLRDFYYAEKIFVNSYYAQRFAYLLYDYIKGNLKKWLRENSQEITILGYGTYSELLLSNLLHILRGSEATKSYKYQTATIEDVEGLKFSNEEILKNSKDINIILVIPIGSTLTTSLKIKRKVMEINPDAKIIGTPITCIVVGTQNDLSRRYWHDIDRASKIITLLDSTKEKYFLLLDSEWFEPYTCKKCFPVDNGSNALEWLEDEKPLFETDKASVVPTTIFYLPGGKKRVGKIDHYLKPEHIYPRQHIVRGKNHFLYYINTNKFYEANKTEIRNWLDGIKNEFYNSKPAVLIAPEHNTNAGFANDVNEIIFGGIGFLIHYNPSKDYKTNFKVFYRYLFSDVKPEIVVIDDAICTGTTIGDIKDCILNIDKDVLKDRDNRERKIKVITMIDRSAGWFKEVAEVTDFQFYPFLSINLPPVKDERFCHLCNDVEKYERIAERVNDVLLYKRFFIYKKEKNEKKDFDAPLTDTNENEKKSNSKRQSRYFEQIKLIDELAEGFHILQKETGNEGKLFPEILEAKLTEKFKDKLKEKDNISLIDAFNRLPLKDKIHYIKALAFPQFLLFKNIRIIATKLVLHELRLYLLQEFNNGISLEEFNYFTVLIKTAGNLNLNILLRSEVINKIIEFFKKLQLLIDERQERIQSQIQESQNEIGSTTPLFNKGQSLKILEEELQELNDIKKDFALKMIYRYCTAVKEVIYNDDAKSFRLECELNKTSDSDLRELLLLENVTVFQSAIERVYDVLRRNEFHIDTNNIQINISRLDELLHKGSLKINEDYRFDYLRKIIYATDKNNYSPNNYSLLDTLNFELKPDDYPTYRRFLLIVTLKLFLKRQREIASIHHKMKFISQIIQEITDADGCFITVNRYNIDIESEIKPDPVIVGTTVDTFLNKTIDNRYLTFKYWNDLMKNQPQTFEISNDSSYHEFKECEEIKSVCVFGIADLRKDGDVKGGKFKCYGVITLFFKQQRHFDTLTMRMPLLLSNDLLGFFKKNYENDSFVEWMDEHKRSETMREFIHDLKTPLIRLKENILLAYDENKIIKIINELLQEIDDRLFVMLSEFKDAKSREKIKIWLYSFLCKLAERYNSVKFNIQIEDKYYLYYNKMALTRIFDNIIQNAMDAGANEITISFDEENKKLFIENDGKSISETNKERIFDKEFSTKIRGTGIGLSIVKRLIEMHNGSIKLEKCDPVTFSITFSEVLYEQ